MTNFSLISAVAQIVAAVVAFFGFMGSLATLALIVDMNRWNGYMRLIFSLTSCQLLSDMAFLIIPYSVDDDTSQDSSLFLIQMFLFSLGSVSVALWTTVISYTLFIVVVYQKNFDLHGKFNIVRVFILLPGILLGSLMVIYHPLYYAAITATIIWIQLVSIIFNLSVHFTVSYMLREMRDNDINEVGILNTEDGTRDTTVTKYNASLYKPVQELARRLEYYPIVQIISLSGMVWYFFGYNLKILGPSHNETIRMFAWYTYSVLTPSAGIGYFIVFMKVQPYAYNRFVVKIRELLRLPVDRTISTQSDLYRLSNSASTRSTEASFNGSAYVGDLSHRVGGLGSMGSMGNDLMRANTNISITSSSHASETMNCETMDEDMLITRIDTLHRQFYAQEAVNTNPIRAKETHDL